MPRKGRIAAVLAIAVAALAAADGCGKTVIDDAKTEGAIEHNLESGLNKKVKSVDCPSGVEVKKGAEFDCTVTLAGGKTETAVLRVLNDEADVELVRLSAAK
ncbi:MAG TPA: DUF4333 domain-containing protein [Solirubrobacterales bacterium]|nr:DUF4333 domain-containing protein [Solirubrobacterales bacterium]